MKSDGGKEAVSAVLSSSHWSSKDGRAGKGHFSLLELCRRLIQEGHDLNVAAIDIDPSEIPDPSKEGFTPSKALDFARKRDKVMAENVVAVANESPGANIVVLVGNVHASLKKGMPWDDEYEPMSKHLKQMLPDVISLNTLTSGGEAWVSTDRGVGPTNMSGEDRGETPFLELFDRPTNGYSGILYVGKITAATPARH
ncbi:erythromycin esterase family protein [Bythopirellula polymerisocia]|uniref:erythromycin esterase family protein n=1 Tax=Bythopirellula polymerisocia TaxID=2528003 RepID=UPI0011B81E30|nr:erythromycin esterase family protein [Bythopirellula polymerisocia]